MEKNEVFTFTAPNGAEVTGVVVLECPCYEDMEGHWEQYIIYAQNRIAFWNFNTDFPDRSRLGGILVDYAILPEYDTILEEYQRDIDMENASTLQNWEEEFEREIQGCNDK